MSYLSLTYAVDVCEDTNQTFDVDQLMALAGFDPIEPVSLVATYVLENGNYVEPPTPLFSIVDQDTILVSAANIANYYGSFVTLSLIGDTGGNLVDLTLTINIVPVNDAPEGADKTIDLGNASAYTLQESDFGFSDPVEGHAFQSVVISSLPSGGTLLLNGQAITTAQAEVSVDDIRAGLLQFQATGNTGLSFDFQVRDNGGTAGCNAADLDASPNTLTFIAATGSIGDRVWRDANGNGVQDTGEQGIACVTVKLAGAGQDGTFGTADDISATTTTDASGNYLFDNLAAGSYKVQFVATNGLSFTTKDAGANDGTDSDAAANGWTDVITLGVGQDRTDVDAGLVKTVCASIVGADKVYEGSTGCYKVQLNCAVAVDTWVTVSAIDGTAERTSFKADCQEIIAGGYYDVRNSRGDVVAVYYDKIPNHMVYASYGNRAATGPSDMSWDYALLGTDCRIDADGTIQVKIAAGSTQSAAFSVQAWKEKVYVDGDVFPCGGYKETAWESLTLTITATSNALVEACCPAKTVYIGDCTSYQLFSPIALDLDGNGIQTTALIDSQGTFDLLGTGQAVHSGWLSSGDAFLAIDNNGNGVIDDISELFGGNVGQGFAKLASFDTDGNGLVDANDADFAKLLVWQDLNGNHATDAGELRTLSDVGLTSLATSYTMAPEDQLGNVLGERSVATLADGRQIDMIDVYFNVDTDQVGTSALPALSELLGASNTLLDTALGSQPVAVAANADVASLPVGGDEAETLRRLTACAA